jgi:predicted LPLAT superfamily acyltransferase/glycosyltransferase involved in cell wall biosynthesis
MDLRPCVVIPLYNHKDAIGTTLARVAAYGLPVFVVDDGSDAPTQATLAALAARHASQVATLRLPVNSGKGAAVMAGLRAASAAGYTHAIQIDADGQHDISDIPLFLAQARQHPDAVMLGVPVYDASAPASRRYGRYLTHLWVWIETLSFAIRDSMCGFRLYPLVATCALIDGVTLPARMDFDIAILVRLAWRGMKFYPIPTHVSYATDGVSPFSMLWDNLRITRSHTRLVAGMLIRLPVLLARKMKIWQQDNNDSDNANKNRIASSNHRNDNRWWRRAERGSRPGIGLLALCCRVFGLRVAGWLLYPVVLYFLLTGRAARCASQQYFTRLRASASASTSTSTSASASASTSTSTLTLTSTIARLPQPGWRTSYRHMLAFAQSGLYKFAAWSGYIKRRDIHFCDTTAMDTIAASGKGALVISSHLGNPDMMRALASHSRHNLVITVVAHTAHAQRFNRALLGANENFSHHLMEVRDFGPQTAMLMQQRIDAGELLVIAGDRVPAHESGRTVNAPFLGSIAPFAQGPYILAHVLACPVYLFFCINERDGYHLYVEPFAQRIILPRRERTQQVAQWAQRYAARLEHYCRSTPYQWFNFFDFWAHPDGHTHD